MNHERGDGTLSRATSISRASRPASSLSRNQSLIKKNVAPHDLRPSDILIERFVAWKAIVKQLIAYFEGIADIENNTARELTKLAGVIQVPFRAGNQFLGEGGMQDVYYGIRDKTRAMSDHHSNLGRTIDGSIVQHLQKLRLEIKAHIKNVQNDTGKLATNVAKERELSAKFVAELQKSIVQYKNTPMTVVAREDPYVANMQVVRQLQKQVNEENALQKSIIIMQQNSAHFEEGIVRSIQSAWQTFDEWQSRMSSQVQDTWRNMSLSMAALAPDREWISFAARSDHLMDPDTPLRNPETVEYPSKEDPSVVAVHTGLLERKKRFTRSYKESYYVLTAAGYLHEFASSDPRVSLTPTFSLFLPACTLGPPSSVSKDKSHKFHIEGKKDGTGTIRGGSILSRREHAYTFRARSHDEMMEWWNDVRMLVARYLVASEQIERRGPVAAAVRAAGYLSEEEDEMEEEGSSFEGDINGASNYHDAREVPPVVVDQSSETMPPSYSHRKDLTENTTVEGYAVSTDKKQLDTLHPDTDDTGGNVSRSPSQRQMEKAPENRERFAQEGETQSGAAPPNSSSRLNKPFQRRFASSSTPSSSVEQAQKTAQSAYAAASRQAGGVLKRLKTLGGPLADRLSGMLGSYREPLTYNLTVARELMKQIYIAERLQPPLSLRLWVDAYSTLSQRARNPSYWREIIKNGQWAVVGLYSIEAYFIFKIGEIIGRRSLIGYKLE